MTIAFDIFDNGGGEAPSVDVKFGGNVLDSAKVPLSFLETGDSFVDVIIRLEGDGTVDVVYNGKIVYDNFPISNYKFIANGRFAFAARTGGLNANQWVDNLRITTAKSSGPLRFTQQPAGALVLVGKQTAFSVQVNDPIGVKYQWFKNDVSIPNATNSTYTTGPLAAADDSSRFKAQATGPGGTATSDPALVTVVSPIAIPTPKISFNFDDGAVPLNTAVYGNAFVDTAGGVNDSGVLKLTEAVNGQAGSFIIEDADGGAPVHGLTAAFKVRVGGGTVPPADGFSFNWANDLPEAAFGEDGSGSGLTVAFDNFDNGGGEAPAIDIRYAAADVASTKVPITLLETGDRFVEVVIRVKADGTLDLIYNENVIYYNLKLTGFNPLAGGRFGLGARTGGLNENQFVDDLRIATALQGAAPKLGPVSLAGGQVKIEWSGGVLQSAPELKGPWADVTNASNPFSVTPSDPRRFYRVRP